MTALAAAKLRTRKNSFQMQANFFGRNPFNAFRETTVFQTNLSTITYITVVSISVL